MEASSSLNSNTSGSSTSPTEAQSGKTACLRSPARKGRKRVTTLTGVDPNQEEAFVRRLVTVSSVSSLRERDKKPGSIVGLTLLVVHLLLMLLRRLLPFSLSPPFLIPFFALGVRQVAPPFGGHAEPFCDV